MSTYTYRHVRADREGNSIIYQFNVLVDGIAIEHQSGITLEGSPLIEARVFACQVENDHNAIEAITEILRQVKLERELIEVPIPLIGEIEV